MSASHPERAERTDATVRLRLYVAGDAPNSVAAIGNLRGVLQQFRKDAVELEIVDVLEQPERGLSDSVLVTPLLRRLSPGPERRIIGRLSDRTAVLALLGFPLHG